MGRQEWAIVGGGRWGRVLTSVATEVMPTDSAVWLVTAHNRPVVNDWLSQQPARLRDRIRIASDIDDVLGRTEIDAVLVANRASQHAETARQALEAGKHVFVEKPLTLEVWAAEEMIALAAKVERVLVVGLVLMFASYLKRLRDFVGSGKIDSLSIDWEDASAEKRHGGIKKFDTGITVAQDVIPHIWSILNVLRPASQWTVSEAKVETSRADISLSDGRTSAIIRLRRGGERRVRLMKMQLASGRALSFDFSTEPGELTVDGQPVEFDTGWADAPRPVFAELDAFRASLGGGAAPAHAAHRCLDSVRLAAAIEDRARL